MPFKTFCCERAEDYRGKNAEQEIWKFDAALVSQINDVLMLPALW
jgi:hypothetical protein